jgi:hypothetical protein
MISAAIKFQGTQAVGLDAMFSESTFQRVFVANDSKPKRIDSRVWPDGVRTDGKTVRVGVGLPFMKSVVVR